MPTPQPYGDIFAVNTPYLDKLSDRLYNEDQRREQYRQQQNQRLDDEFARNLSGIRDSDIGDLTKAYGDYKLAFQSSMKKRGGVTPEEQLQILRKKADVYDIINKSKQQREWETMQGKQIATDKKGIYSKDAHDKLMKRMGLPVSKLSEFDDNDLLYKYYVPDLAKELETARGAKRKKELILGVDEKDPLKDKKEIYDIRANPNEFYGNLLNQLATSNKAENFAGFKINQYSDEELENLKNRYIAKVNDPKFKAVYGEVKDFPAMNTRLGQATATQTMEEFADLPLNAITKSEPNATRVATRREEFAKAQQERSARNSLARMYVYANIQDRKPETIGRNIDNLIGQHIEDARGNNGEVVTDNATFESITGKKKTGSSVLLFDEANNKYTYGTKDGTTGEVKVVGEVPIDLARVKLTKTYKSGLDSKYNTGKNLEVKVKPDAYKTDTNAKNWKSNGDGTYIYVPTGQKVDSKGNVIKQ